MARPRYAIHPGWITSINDGDEHYIGAAKLAALYGLKPKEYVIVREDRPQMISQAEHYVHLYPRYSGDYTLPE